MNKKNIVEHLMDKTDEKNVYVKLIEDMERFPKRRTDKSFQIFFVVFFNAVIVKGILHAFCYTLV